MTEPQHIKFEMSFYVEESPDGFIAYPEHAENIVCKGSSKAEAAKELFITTISYIDELWED